MKVSVYPHASAALPPARTPVPINDNHSLPVRYKSPVGTGIRTLDRLAHHSWEISEWWLDSKWNEALVALLYLPLLFQNCSQGTEDPHLRQSV